MPATCAATAISATAGSTPRPSISSAPCRRRPTTASRSSSSTTTWAPGSRSGQSLNQYLPKPVPAGCARGATAAPGCGTVTLFNNGFNAAPAPTGRRPCRRGSAATIAAPSSADDGSMTSTTRRPGAISSCSMTGTSASRPAPRSAIGDFPSYNYMSDVTKRGEVLGMDSTTFFGGFYNTLTASSDTRNVMPAETRRWAAVEQSLQRDDQLRSARTRRTEAHSGVDRGRRASVGKRPI